LKVAQRRHARFVNTTMMVTGLGAAISDTLADGRVVSGVGGQYNFVAMAHALPEARSILCVRATRESRGELTSSIPWSYGSATIPRHLRDIVVSEYGIADLRGKSDEHVVAAMLDITDSRFQDDLLRQAKAAGKIAKSYEIAPAKRDNYPERIATALAPLRERGLLPAFPFGTDFTPLEQRLIGALELLENATPLRLARLALAGLGSSEEAAIARMGLNRPLNAAQYLSRVLLRGALKS
jgi:hypothetical protein